MFDPSMLLSDVEKLDVVERRIRSFANDAYNHKINLDAITKNSPDVDVSEIEEALDTIEQAIKDNLALVVGIELPEGAEDSAIFRARAVFEDE